MKLKLMLFVVMAVLVGMAGNSLAQAQADEMEKAIVPFDFYADAEKMPAGTYTIGLDLETKMITLADASGQRKVFLMGNVADEGNETSELVFEHSGNAYQLKEVKSENIDLTVHTRTLEKTTASNDVTPVEVTLNHR